MRLQWKLKVTDKRAFYGAQTRDGAPSTGHFSGDEEEEQDAKFPGNFLSGKFKYSNVWLSLGPLDLA